MADFYSSLLHFFESIGNFLQNMLDTFLGFFTLLGKITSRVLLLGNYVPYFVVPAIGVVVGIYVLKMILDML